MSPSELAIQESVHKSSITRLVNRLVQNGYARRQADPSDRRRDVLAITAAGTTALRDSRMVVNGWYVARIAQLSGPKRRALLAAMPALRRLSDVQMQGPP